jgi:methylmalonyl-CoA mutase
LTHTPSRAGEKPETGRKVRFVTAAALFDGHDAAINIMRRILQSQGAEVIHLGHSRSVDDVVTAAIQEDVHGIAVSSYQGGHVEYFKYMVNMLRERGAGDIKVFGGGGGVIVKEEIEELEAYGVERIYSPQDGQEMGLDGMIADMIRRADFDPAQHMPENLDRLVNGNHADVTRIITGYEEDTLDPGLRDEISKLAALRKVPVLGITGTGGAGKSSLTDELIHRFRADREDLSIALIAVDPSKRKSGGALLGDRIRMNANSGGKVFMRSLATREAGAEIAVSVPPAIEVCKAARFDLIIVETSGIGQGDAAIVPFVDVSLYVMTPEFGAPSQLEKIDMLDFANLVAINKFDRRGAEDALRDVRKQYQRGHELFDTAPEDMPVFGTIASRFNDDGVTSLYVGVLDAFSALGPTEWATGLAVPETKSSSARRAIVPPERSRSLAEVAETVRAYLKQAGAQAATARERQQLRAAKAMLEAADDTASASPLDKLAAEREEALTPESRRLLDGWPDLRDSYGRDEFVAKVRDREIRTALTVTSLSGSRIPKVALPHYDDDGELLKWLLRENLPGHFPFTAGVFPFKREDEDPTRMFAGEGDPFRTNERFKFLSRDSKSKRLSTAFDSVTLYGFDPHERPDIYGKVGNSGVSIATLDDIKVLYGGFDLCNPLTSVSMTINGPAPTILAMYLNTAIDQQIEKFAEKNGRQPNDQEREEIIGWTHRNVRGTVQADILKEDQGQNTCIFSTEFALTMMGDIQQYFVDHGVRNFYSVSISGYHIAEAGANPISQLAFTLANGFTYVEAYLARGMDIDDFAPNLSFFFSNGMDPEYAVMGRVARRIWAVALRDKYGANERSQKLKYHVQTSGRSLHAQEVDFNDIRTTLQALIAIYDNCNSLHTNAHDEAFTTPTAESVRRALAIQMVINREWGLAKNENPNQGAFIIDNLTDLVEEAVLLEFERIAERGGVLGAMETGYQRGKIQDESLYYETLKHDGTLPIVGVNTFLNPERANTQPTPQLQRSTREEKDSQINRLREFQATNRAQSDKLLARLKETARAGGNTFEVLLQAVRCCSLGQITGALFEVGGQYRRNM